MADDDKKDDTPVADKTPDTPPPADSEPKTEPAPAHDDSLRAAVARLEETVQGLSAQVANMTPTPGDERPTSVPWTHRKFS